MTIDIGKFLREKRINKELTQKNVADFVGVTEATVSRWESGEIGNMRRDRIAKLSTILDISPLHLLVDINDTTHSMHKYAESKESEVPEYYHDPEVARIAQEMHDNPDIKVLFNASRGLKKESIEEVRKFIEFQKAKEMGDFD